MSERPSQPDAARLREQMLLAQARITELEAELAGFERRLEQERSLTSQAQLLADRHLTAAANSENIAAQCAHLNSEFSRIQARIAGLDAERRAMLQSRSWRWTAWLRSVERLLSRER